MKKLGRIILLVLVIATLVAVSVSCKSESDISVKEDPQLVHVQGEELDLSKGVLKVNTGKKTQEIAMNADGVSVSGYDKNKLGEQEITLSYNGGSTTVKVTVVERMKVVDYVSDYLVGDTFNTSKGRLRITKNDGTTYTVLLSNSLVTVENFDSSSAGSGKKVTVKYASGNDSFETEFNVNIYDVESVDLTAPKKYSYKSHESSLSLDGGYLVLSGNGGKVTRDVKLTGEGVKIEGFDPSVVNETTPEKRQTITVTYNDTYTKSFDIKITYTSVSMFNDNIHKFADLDFENNNTPEISKELGELAITLMELYTDISKADSLLIADADLITVARAALTYGYNAWVDDVLSFDGAFEYQYDFYYGAYLNLTCESREAIVAALEGLAITDRPIYKMYDTIIAIGSIELLEDEVYKYVKTPIVGGEMFSEMIPMFEHMLDFYDDYLPLIPEGWENMTPEEYKDGVESVYAFIKEGAYVNTGNSWIYADTLKWDEKYSTVKPFDALYTYYYGTMDADALYLLANVVLPTDFDGLVNFISVVLTQLDYISAGYEYDTTEFFYNYYNLIKYVDEIANVTEGSSEKEQMLAVFYYSLPVNIAFDGYESAITFGDLIDYIYTGGIMQLSHALLDVEAYNKLMDAYMAAVKAELDNKEGYLTSPEFAAAVEEMLKQYLSLTETQQNMFLSSLMPYYMSAAPKFSFDNAEEYADYVSRFNRYLNEYFNAKFTSENARAAYTALMVANEIYSRRFDVQTWAGSINWIEEYKSSMSTFAEKLAAIETEEERQLFLSYFDALKTRCEATLTVFSDGEINVTLGDWQAIFDALNDAIVAMNDASYAIDNGLMDDEGYYFYNIFFSAYERARSLSAYILNNGTPDVIKAYYHQSLYEISYETSDGGTVTYGYSYDYMIDIYRSNFVVYVLNAIGDMEIYNELGYPEFFDVAYDLLIPYYNSLFYEDIDFVVDPAKVIAIMNAYSKLSPDAKLYHLLMEGGMYSSYYGAIDEFIASNYPSAVQNVALNLIDLEYAYIIYHYSLYFEDESYIKESLATIESTLNSLVELYTSLEGENKEAFADFEELYAHYVALCEELLNGETESGDTAA